MSLSLILNILPDDQGYSWTSLECVISQINKIALSLLWSLSILSVEVQGFSQLWLLQCIKGERVVCTYSSLPVIRPAVRGKLFLFLFQLEYPLYHFHICRAKKKNVTNYTAMQMIAWMCITYRVICSAQKWSIWNVNLEQ